MLVRHRIVQFLTDPIFEGELIIDRSIVEGQVCC